MLSTTEIREQKDNSLAELKIVSDLFKSNSNSVENERKFNTYSARYSKAVYGSELGNHVEDMLSEGKSLKEIKTFLQEQASILEPYTRSKAASELLRLLNGANEQYVRERLTQHISKCTQEESKVLSELRNFTRIGANPHSDVQVDFNKLPLEKQIMYCKDQLFGDGSVEKNPTQGFARLQEILAKDPDNSLAKAILGRAYQTGLGTPEDMPKAERYEKMKELYSEVLKDYPGAAGVPNLAHSEALMGQGWMYAEGKGVEEDDKKAFELYQRAVEADPHNSDALDTLGWMYAEGKGVEEDDKKAFELYQRAVDADPHNLLALCDLGIMYANGRGVEVDNKKAIELYQRALDINPKYANALNDLGLMYTYGKGVERDDKKAFELYQRAVDADPDNSYALNNLGKCYLWGKGVDRDDKKAVELFKRAVDADDENTNATFNLGRCYLYQKGGLVLTDETKKYAIELITKSAAAGNEAAKNFLNSDEFKKNFGQ